MNVIDRARERIERDGWYQGAYQGPHGGHCVLGALAGDASPVRLLIREQTALSAIRAEIGPHRMIAEWNDDPSTSLEDVLLVMKRASARLDGVSR